MRKRKTKKREDGFTREAGFTLIELMIVLCIVGALLAMILPRVGGVLDRADERATHKNLINLQTAIEDFADSNGGVYPNLAPGGDANGNGVDDLTELSNIYFNGGFPEAKLRRGATTENGGVVQRISPDLTIRGVNDSNGNRIIEPSEIEAAVESSNIGGWLYITAQPAGTRPNVVGTVVINCDGYMTDGKTKYCSLSSR